MPFFEPKCRIMERMAIFFRFAWTFGPERQEKSPEGQPPGFADAGERPD
jgi:hypothetical protein